MSPNNNPEENVEDPMEEYANKFGISREEVMVKVVCPECGMVGKVSVDKEMVKNSPGQVMRFAVVPGMICDHAFIVAIDTNFVSR